MDGPMESQRMENSPLEEIEEYEFCGFLLWNGKNLFDVVCRDERLT